MISGKFIFPRLVTLRLIEWELKLIIILHTNEQGYLHENPVTLSSGKHSRKMMLSLLIITRYHHQNRGINRLHEVNTSRPNERTKRFQFQCTPLILELRPPKYQKIPKNSNQSLNTEPSRKRNNHRTPEIEVQMVQLPKPLRSQANNNGDRSPRRSSTTERITQLPTESKGAKNNFRTGKRNRWVAQRNRREWESSWLRITAWRLEQTGVRAVKSLGEGARSCAAAVADAPSHGWKMNLRLPVRRAVSWGSSSDERNGKRSGRYFCGVLAGTQRMAERWSGGCSVDFKEPLI